MCAENDVFGLLTASTTSEVKNDYAHAITQDICNKFIEINFSIGYILQMYGLGVMLDMTTTTPKVAKVHLMIQKVVCMFTNKFFNFFRSKLGFKNGSVKRKGCPLLKMKPSR